MGREGQLWRRFLSCPTFLTCTVKVNTAAMEVTFIKCILGPSQEGSQKEAKRETWTVGQQVRSEIQTDLGHEVSGIESRPKKEVVRR